MLTNFEYHPARFQITGIYKTTMFEKSIVHHVVKKRSKFLYSVSSENTEGGPLFCAPVKFPDYYQYANKYQVPGLRPGHILKQVFFERIPNFQNIDSM